MQRTSLSLALILGLASTGPASAAMELSRSGRGQVLLFPYYTVNKDNGTLLSLVNHTDEVKALKIRFREAFNGRDVLDFNLYLPPRGHWRGGLSAADSTGPARLIDNSPACTAPIIPAEGVAFRNNLYVGSHQDDGRDSLDRTREGFIEVIEMGVLVDDGDVAGTALPLPDAPGNLAGVDNVPGDGNKHFASDAIQPEDDVGANCSSLVEAWSTGGVWNANPSKDIDEPAGGISGMATIVDVQAGVSYNAPPEVIDGFFTIANSGALHTDPGALLPTLVSARTRAQGLVESIDSHGEISLWKAGTADAVSALLMRESIANRLETGSALQADSEWVVTFPTKHLHIDQVGANAASRLPFTDSTDDSPEDLSIAGNVPDTSVVDPHGSCEPVGLIARAQSGYGIEPAQTCFDGDLECEERIAPRICFQANVIAFNQFDEVGAGHSAIFGSRLVAKSFDFTTPSNTELETGQVEMSLGDDDNSLLSQPLSEGSPTRHRIFGLPVIGFWAGRFVNANAQPGLLASYAVTAPHTGGVRQDRVESSGTESP